MKDLDTLDYFPMQEELVEAIQAKIQNKNHAFFRIMVAFYFSQISTMMRTSINFPGVPHIPTNMFAINLSQSGSGKGFSTRLIEDQVIDLFCKRFMKDTFVSIVDRHLQALAVSLPKAPDESAEEMYEKLSRDFERQGPMVMSFDSGTTAAVKQMRMKLLMANIGSINLIMDEAFSNLLGNTEVLSTYLELFDGKVKQKLLKHTKENIRTADLDGITPTNMLLFGTPSKLFNDPKVEAEFLSMLETGYARRCFFGFNPNMQTHSDLSPAERLALLKSSDSSKTFQKIQTHLANLAAQNFYNVSLDVPDEVALIFMEYQALCEEKGKEYPEHKEIQKAELTHRYFKALKLAGTYAFISGSRSIKEEHAYAAIKLAEDSGKAFDKLSKKEGNHVKLAKYIRDIGSAVTQVDLVDNLPFYKGSEAHRRELLNLAIAYGYRNNIIIRKYYQDDIEFLKGEAIPETDLNKIIVSYSRDNAKGYLGQEVPFKELYKLTQKPGFSWCTHHFEDDYRSSNNVKLPFNLIVVDVDDGLSIDIVKKLLEDYTYHLYTTKRHTAQSPRYRIVFPTSNIIKLSPPDHKEFMSNFYDWLPFDVDRQTGDIARKWLSNKGQYEYNEGELIDVFEFIPKTKQQEARIERVKSYGNLSSIEKWFIENTAEGNRSNQMIRYGYLLVDMGYSIDDIRDKILVLNSKLSSKLTENEILGTILVSVTKKIQQRAN